jgi:hypothetical protein
MYEIVRGIPLETARFASIVAVRTSWKISAFHRG